MDFFLLRNHTTIIGRSALRHWLTPALENVGGHIGCRIRPTERREG
jgi:predicted acetyltransferase